MDEQNQTPEEQNKNAIAEAGKQLAKETAKNAGKQVAKKAGKAGKAGKAVGEALKQALKVAIKALASIIAKYGIIILVLVLVVGIVAYAFSYVFTDISEEVASGLKSYVIIGDEGPEFIPKALKEMVNKYLDDNIIDKKDLCLGTELQADRYLCQYMLASLSTQLPYIPRSTVSQLWDALNTSAVDVVKNLLYESDDPQPAQGIVKIKRQTGDDKPKDLNYIKYEDFTKKIEEDTRNKTKKSLEYFSLDASWMLCVSRYIDTLDPDTDAIISSSVTEVKIPFQRMVSQYSMPFNFLLTLQQSTQNAEYVLKVAEMIKDGEIELTIFDEISTVTTEYTATYTLHRRWLEDVPTGAYVADGTPITTQVPLSSEGEQTDVSKSKIRTNTIKVNVTKADVWVIRQKTAYKKENKTEYPLGPDGTTTGPTDEGDPGGDVCSWRTNIIETNKETVEKEEWLNDGTETKIEANEFLGLWRNRRGYYFPKSKYRPKGKLVYYKLPNSDAYNSPIEMIYSNEDMMYENLQRSELTQNHAQIMKYLVEVYKTRKEIEESGVELDLDLDVFNPDEFNQANWTNIGGGFWWPLDDTSLTTITSGFGPRNTGIAGASTNHKGIDIAAPVGSKVIAVADGTVEIAAESTSAGKWIRINHGNGIKTVYMHNSQLLVSVGQNVKQGDVIALSGNTGVSSGPHLHFGVEVNGEYVDPLNYVNPSNPRPTNSAPDVAASTEAWQPYILQAFQELGYTCTDEKMTRILSQIQTETGGNQNRVQGIKDVNSGKPIPGGGCQWCPSPTGESCGNTNIGHGLLQYIPGTWAGSIIPGHENIWNGYDQLIALIWNAEVRGGGNYHHIGNGTGWSPY